MLTKRLNFILHITMAVSLILSCSKVYGAGGEDINLLESDKKTERIKRVLSSKKTKYLANKIYSFFNENELLRVIVKTKKFSADTYHLKSLILRKLAKKP